MYVPARAPEMVEAPNVHHCMLCGNNAVNKTAYGNFLCDAHYPKHLDNRIPHLATKDFLIADLKRREDKFWQLASLFVEHRDAHGVMDMGAELQALQRARSELSKLEG